VSLDLSRDAGGDECQSTEFPPADGVGEKLFDTAFASRKPSDSPPHLGVLAVHPSGTGGTARCAAVWPLRASSAYSKRCPRFAQVSQPRPGPFCSEQRSIPAKGACWQGLARSNRAFFPTGANKAVPLSGPQGPAVRVSGDCSIFKSIRSPVGDPFCCEHRPIPARENRWQGLARSNGAFFSGEEKGSGLLFHVPP